MSEIIVNLLLFIILLLHSAIFFLRDITRIIPVVFLIFLFTSAVFAFMGFSFLAVLYLIVYVGAVMILIVVAVKTTDITQKMSINLKNLPAFLLSGVFGGILIYIFAKAETQTYQNLTLSYTALSDMLFNKNLLIVETISLILFASIVAVVNILKKEQ